MLLINPELPPTEKAKTAKLALILYTESEINT